MGKRASYRMVDENDPQFCRFWDIYPRRVAKKEARKTWAQLNPSPELVDRIVAALVWQIPAFRWDAESADFAPYPASWLNDERWTDERRKAPRANQPPAHEPWSCPHVDECTHKAMCRLKRNVGIQKYPLKANAEAS
jgi:hypothetical protein